MKQLISEANGQLSSARLVLYFGILIAAAVTIHAIVAGTVAQDLQVIIVWIAGPGGFKTIQKFAEPKE